MYPLITAAIDLGSLIAAQTALAPDAAGGRDRARSFGARPTGGLDGADGLSAPVSPFTVPEAGWERPRQGGTTEADLSEGLVTRP